MIDSSAVEDYVTAITGPDRSAATRVVRRAIERGASAADVSDLLIGPGQARIGDLWETGEINVSAEHVATALSADMARLAATTAPAPPRLDANVLVVTPPGEWHRLAGEAIGAVLEAAGARVVVAPPLLAAGRLIPLLHDEGPEVLVLSCSMPANLAAAHRIVSIAGQARTPLVAGGRGFSAKPDRAAVLGVDFAPSIAVLLRRLAEADAASIPTATDGDVARRSAHLDRALTDLSAAMVARATDLPGPGDAATDGLWLVRALISALVCSDSGILSEQLAWQDRRHRVAGVTSGAALGALLVEAVSDVLPDELPTVETALAGW